MTLSKLRILVILVIGLISWPATGQEKQESTDKIAEQARSVREQTLRHASDLEKIRNEFNAPRNIVQQSIQNSTPEEFELALERLKKRQSLRLQKLTEEVDDLLNKIRELGKKPAQPQSNADHVQPQAVIKFLSC